MKLARIAMICAVSNPVPSPIYVLKVGEGDLGKGKEIRYLNIIKDNIY